jgi:hypothetical protein
MFETTPIRTQIEIRISESPEIEKEAKFGNHLTIDLSIKSFQGTFFSNFTGDIFGKKIVKYLQSIVGDL